MITVDYTDDNVFPSYYSTRFFKSCRNKSASVKPEYADIDNKPQIQQPLLVFRRCPQDAAAGFGCSLNSEDTAAGFGCCLHTQQSCK